MKDLKGDIERIQKLIERNREKLQKDFEKWLEVMMVQKTALSQPQSTMMSIGKNSLTMNPNAYSQASLNQSVTSSRSLVIKIICYKIDHIFIEKRRS